MELKNKVIAEIKKIYDPEIPVNIYELGLIYDVSVDKKNVSIKISLSDNAAERIKEIMSKAEKDSVGVRVGVKSGGCAGMSYIMEYTKKISPNDEVIEDKGVKLFVDPGAIIYLLGTEMDYKKSEFSSSFVFKNPNETERCGCGESFKV